MATVIERVLAHMDDLAAKSVKGDGVSKAELEKLATSIQEIKDLTDEFKKELLVICRDLVYKCTSDGMATDGQKKAIAIRNRAHAGQSSPRAPLL